MKTLAWINLAGVLALGVLCVAQWRDNRELNHELNRLERIRLDHATKLDERERALAGLRGDLEELKGQVLGLTDTLRQTEGKLALEERTHALAVAERDQLKEAVARWAQAVEARDTRLTENHDRIRELAQRLNDVVTRHNDIAGSYNEVVKLLNERTVAYNEVVRQLNQPPAERGK